jgi:CRP-like cAMP-binding protein
MKSTDTQTVTAEFKARFPTIASQLGPEHLSMLLEGASVQELPAGRALIRDRMPVDFLYFILEGALGVYIENAGKSIRVATVKPGEWLGEVSVLSGEFLASATITSDTACTLLKMHHVSFDKLITTNEVIAKVMLEHFIELMARRLRGSRTSG